MVGLSNTASIIKRFRTEELATELRINYLRMGIFTMITLFEVSLMLSRKFPAERFYYTFPLHLSVIAIAIVAHFMIKMSWQQFMMKYILTAVDLGWIFAVTLITRHYLPPTTAMPLHHMGAALSLYVLIALGGLRFDYRLAIWSLLLSVGLLGALHYIDRVYYGMTDDIISANVVSMGLTLASTAAIMVVICVRARSLAVKHINEAEQMSLAQRIQENLIPDGVPVIPGVRFYSIYKPMNEVGGDFYDFIHFKDGAQVGIFISDVSGHGVPAAIITSMIKMLITTADERKHSPVDLLSYLNTKTIGLMSGNFFTAFYGIYDTNTRVLSYARGGHTYPYLMHRDGSVVELESNGVFLGVIDECGIEENRVTLEPGDKLLLYTDGLVETMNTAGEQFWGILADRVLSQQVSGEIESCMKYIYGRLTAFKGDENFDDDICIVGMEVV